MKTRLEKLEFFLSVPAWWQWLWLLLLLIGFSWEIITFIDIYKGDW